VAVILLSSSPENANKEVTRTETDAHGDFIFPNVNAGRYSLALSHPRWRTLPDLTSTPPSERVQVAVDTGNGVVPPGSLKVLGFDVSGRVTGDGEQVKDVDFLLFGAKEAFVDGCSTKMPAHAAVSLPKSSPLVFKCFVSSNEAGVFTFPSISPGKYLLVPSFVLQTAGTRLKFDVRPSELEFSLEPSSGSLVMPTEFVVSGFGVTGRVISSSKTKSGLGNAEVYFDGEQVAKSDASGAFSVTSVKTGEYTVNVKKERYVFDEVKVKISPKSPVLPDLAPAKIEVCGRVAVEGLPPSLKPGDVSVVVDGGEFEWINR
jgi:hypothetical protein